jgi:NAD(P)H dehydrogenase (quinone)
MATVTPKVAIIYYSSTGTIHAMAQDYAKGLENAGAEVRIRKVHELAPPEAIAANEAWAQHAEATKDVPEATADDVLWADAVVFGTPTRYGNVTAQLKQFIDTLGPQWSKGQLADKVYSAFSSTSTEHGGQETTILALYTTVHHFGGIVVAPGYTDPVKFSDGNPYGTGFVSGQGPDPDQVALDAAVYQGKRVAEIAAALKRGLATA